MRSLILLKKLNNMHAAIVRREKIQLRKVHSQRKNNCITLRVWVDLVSALVNFFHIIQKCIFRQAVCPVNGFVRIVYF